MTSTESYVVAVVTDGDCYRLERMSIQRFADYQQRKHKTTSDLVPGYADLSCNFDEEPSYIKAEHMSDTGSESGSDGSEYSLNQEVDSDLKREKEENDCFLETAEEGEPFSDEESLNNEHRAIEELLEEEEQQLQKDIDDLIRRQGHAAFDHALSRIRNEEKAKTIQRSREKLNEQRVIRAQQDSLNKTKKRLAPKRRRVLSSSTDSSDDDNAPRKYIARSNLGFRAVRDTAEHKDFTTDEDEVVILDEKESTPELIVISDDDEVLIVKEVELKPKLSQCLRNFVTEWNGVGYSGN